MPVGKGETAQGACDRAFPDQHAINADAASGPANQTCSPDPATGGSTCTTPTSDTENKVDTTIALAGPDLAVDGSPELIYLVLEAALDLNDWGLPNWLESHHHDPPGCKK